MAKKSLFEKLGLVESDEPVAAQETENVLRVCSGVGDHYIAGDFPLDEPMPIQAEVPEGDTIDIGAVYESNGMSPADKVTVYKIQDMLASLPSEMSNKNKKTTLKNLMGTLGYDSVDIQQDAQQRIELLNAAANQKTAALNDEITANSQKIEDYKLEIERLTARNSDAVQAINSIIETVTTERHGIEGVLEFLKDEPAGKESA